MLIVCGCTSQLERAVGSRDTAAVRKAIAAGGKVNGNYWTDLKFPVQLAIENNDLETLKLLREAGATLGAWSFNDATEYGSTGLYDYLVTNGFSVTNCSLPTTLMHWMPKDTELGGIMIPPLGIAIARRDLESVKRVIDFGSPLFVSCTGPASLGGNYTFSAILAAAIIGDPEIINYLLTRGANPNTLNLQGMTPLAIASQRGNYEAARILLASGAFHTYDQAARQPIEYAVDNHHQDLIQLLQSEGAIAPVRINPTAALGNITAAVIDGAVFAGTLWILAKGIQSGTYVDAPSTSSLAHQPALQAGNVPPRKVSKASNANCQNDYDCAGFFGVCLKRPYESKGICVEDASLEGDSPDNVGVRIPPLGPMESKSCQIGFRYDPSYDACVQ